MSDLHVYDTTLRDGAQQEGLNLSVTDKLTIASHLDDLGVGLHRRWLARGEPEGHRVLRPGRHRPHPQERDPRGVRRDPAGRRQAPPRTPSCGRCSTARRPWSPSSRSRTSGTSSRALRTTREENLEMIRDTVAFLRGEGRRVFLDAEHFFDGYAVDRAYALEALRAAAESGARGARPVRHQRRHAAQPHR